MFKWVWLIILGIIWFLWFCLAIKDVVMTIKWCEEHNEKDFYNRFEGATYVFLLVSIFWLVAPSLAYCVASL
jgi:hypothetical protein